MDETGEHFIDQVVEVFFDSPPALEKSPPCPDGFRWNGEIFRVEEMLAEWRSYARRGRMENNMSPEHAARAAGRGSWGVGRFFYRVRVAVCAPPSVAGGVAVCAPPSVERGVGGGRIFDLYYDRAPGDADHRKGRWILLAERRPV